MYWSPFFFFFFLHIQSMSSVRPYAFSWVFLFICRSSSLVHFKNGPDYLMMGTARVLISLMRFLLCSLVLNSFLFLLRYSFLNFFFHLCLFDIIRFQYFSGFVSFLFSECSDFFLDLVVLSIPSVICDSLLFIISMAHFSISNFHPYIITVHPHYLY